MVSLDAWSKNTLSGRECELSSFCQSISQKGLHCEQHVDLLYSKSALKIKGFVDVELPKSINYQLVCKTQIHFCYVDLCTNIH